MADDRAVMIAVVFAAVIAVVNAVVFGARRALTSGPVADQNSASGWLAPMGRGWSTMPSA